jgi:hypothetical protein
MHVKTVKRYVLPDADPFCIRDFVLVQTNRSVVLEVHLHAARVGKHYHF